MAEALEAHRMKSALLVRCSTGIILAACLSVTPARAQKLQSTDFHRGIGIAHVMAWASIDPSASRAFTFPPFQYPADALERELGALHRTGFDFVRLAVDPGPFLQFRGSRRDHLDLMLLQRVQLILSRGLAVIVDFHPSDMHEDYRADVLTRGAETKLFQDYLDLLSRTARLLDALQSRRVMLEIMNEPPARPAAWRPMLEAAYNAVRSVAPHLLLLLDGGDAPIPENTTSFGEFRDDAAAFFSFHYYEPYQFTHQGAPWMAARYLTDVPYPALARSLQDSLDASSAAITASNLSAPEKLVAKVDARDQLESYRRSSFSRDTIKDRFQRMANWARDNNIPDNRVILGEFGAIKNAQSRNPIAHAERARWFRDVREEAEAHGFGWAAWAYRGSGGFSLTPDEASLQIEPLIVQALGLR
jgi:endoglucanase